MVPLNCAGGVDGRRVGRAVGQVFGGVEWFVLVLDQVRMQGLVRQASSCPLPVVSGNTALSSQCEGFPLIAGVRRACTPTI